MATGYSQEWSARNSIYTAYFRIYYATSYNASTNTSTVTITPQLMTSADFGNDYRVFNGAGLSGAGVYGNGVCLYSFGTNYGSGNYLSCGSAHSYYRDLGSWSFTVSHNADGDASFTVGICGSVLAMYFSGTGYTYNQCFIGSVGDTVSDTITIHENAASSIASSSASVTTQGTYSLTMNRKASSNYHVVTFLYNNSTVLYSSGHFGTSYTLDIPRSFFRNYPSLSSLPVTVSVQTYNSSGTAIGSPATTSLTVNADADMKPVVSSGWVSLAPYNTGAVSGFTGYVQGYSRAQATFNSSKISMTNAVGASIASYSVTCQGSVASTSPYLTNVLSSTSVSVVCTVTDTRGRSASQTFTLTVMAYAKPKLTGIAIFRCNTNGTASEGGTKYSAKATLTYSSLNSQNRATLVCAVAAAGGSYGSAEALTSGQARISTANLNADVHRAHHGNGRAWEHRCVLPGPPDPEVGDEVPPDGKRRRIRQGSGIQQHLRDHRGLGCSCRRQDRLCFYTRYRLPRWVYLYEREQHKSGDALRRNMGETSRQISACGGIGIFRRVNGRRIGGYADRRPDPFAFSLHQPGNRLAGEREQHRTPCG